MVSSSARTWVRGSHRSFLFLEQRGYDVSPFVPTALGWSDNPRCEPHMPRSHSWSRCGNLTSSSLPAPSSALQTHRPGLPSSPPPSLSSLRLIVPSEVGRVQLSQALRGKWQSHSLCCWPCWCQGGEVFQCWTGPE